MRDDLIKRVLRQVTRWNVYRSSAQTIKTTAHASATHVRTVIAAARKRIAA
jgi:hypothetical protein